MQLFVCRAKEFAHTKRWYGCGQLPHSWYSWCSRMCADGSGDCSPVFFLPSDSSDMCEMWGSANMLLIYEIYVFSYQPHFNQPVGSIFGIYQAYPCVCVPDNLLDIQITYTYIHSMSSRFFTIRSKPPPQPHLILPSKCTHTWASSLRAQSFSNMRAGSVRSSVLACVT